MIPKSFIPYAKFTVDVYAPKTLVDSVAEIDVSDKLGRLINDFEKLLNESGFRVVVREQ